MKNKTEIIAIIFIMLNYTGITFAKNNFYIDAKKKYEEKTEMGNKNPKARADW